MLRLRHVHVNDGGQVLDLSAEFTGPGRGLDVFGLEVRQEFGDVHAASSGVSRQDGLGVVRRRGMSAIDAQ